MSAATACAEYERWAAEVQRLTAAIAGVECPHEEGLASCFGRERQVIVTHWDGEPRGPRTLEEVAAEVRDCPSCSRLCLLIARRKHARQRFGVAKRAVRRAGKAALAEGAA